jgi:3-isopropylmalate/(R)-2-methylmalate dehydratase small subunit
LRFDSAGNPIPDFDLNKPESQGCAILVGGHNFGCGSSREHAPWALLDHGIRAVVSTEIADIFRNNSLKNGLIPIIVDTQTHQYLLQNPGINVAIDVAAATLTLPDGRSIAFPIDGFARYCLVEGIDQLGFLRKQLDTIEQFEKGRSWTP